MNIAPMGPVVPESEPWSQVILKPFRTSTTYANLRATGEAVLHVTDDVLLLAQSAVGALEPFPRLMAATTVNGFILADACRYYELRALCCDEEGPRATLVMEVTHSGSLRDFFGLNRGHHAVLELAILATRMHILPREEILDAIERLRPLVEKTGGGREKKAFAHLVEYIHRSTFHPQLEL